MATVTVRNLDPNVVERIKQTAKLRGISMEQEIRMLLESTYAPKDRVAERVRTRWNKLPAVTAEEIDAWKNQGRS